MYMVKPFCENKMINAIKRCVAKGSNMGLHENL